MLHPPIVHFAIVLPLVALVFSLIYLLKRDESMSKISSRTTLIAALAMAAAWYSGNQAGPEIYDFLSAEGKEELMGHKTLGLYLAIAMGVIAVIQMAGSIMKKFAVEALAVVLLLGATVVTFAQGKDGGEIVYNHGMPFKAYMIEDSLKDAVAEADELEEDSDKAELYEDTIDEISMHSDKVNKVLGIETNEEDEDEE